MKHENYSLGYDMLRAYIKSLHRFLHRNIMVAGLDNIPENKPIIFAPNHQNALMDPMAVLLSCHQQPTWLARADVFGNPFTDPILKFLKISPVYRIRDGRDKLSKNDVVFDLAIRVLKNNKSLALFPEGQHSFRKQSLAHKKAVPRIAFMAEEKEKFELDIQIIPVGIYYSHYNDINRELFVNFGKPISVKDFKEEFLQNKNSAHMSLRAKIYDNLVPLTVHIESKDQYEAYETLLDVYRNDKPRNNVKQRFLFEQLVVASIEKHETEAPEQASDLLAVAEKYKQEMGKIRVSDKVVSQNRGFAAARFQVILALLSMPVFIHGWLNFSLSIWLPSFVMRKKIKDKVFWATVEFVLSLILIPLFSLLQFGLVLIFTGNFWISLAYLLSLPLFGKISMYLADYYKSTLKSFRFSKNRQVIKSIIALRVQISSLLDKLMPSSD